MRKFGLLVCLATAGFAVVASPGAAATTCGPILQAVNEARAAGDLDRLASLYASATEPTCSGKETFCIGRSVALGFLQRAYTTLNARSGIAEAENILQRGYGFGTPWQLLVAQGDIAFDRGASGDKAAYTVAARKYELAINDLSEQYEYPANGAPEKSICGEFGEPASPSDDQISTLRKKAAEAKLLAPSFEVVATKSGECGGIFLQGTKGFEPVSTPIPVEFEYNSAAFTQKGRDAATGLLQCVKPYSRIQLSGHTDKVGSDGFNMDLSTRRLAAVKAFLVSGGYPGTIVLEPKGKREPFQVDDPSQHSEAEIDQMNRRVELRGATK